MKKLFYTIFILPLFLFIVTPAFAETIFEDNFQGANGTALSTHDNHWSFPTYMGLGSEWGEYVIENNTAQSGSNPLFDINDLNVALSSHFIVTKTFNFHPNISSDTNQAFLDIRVNDISNNYSNVIRFYPTTTSTTIDSYIQTPSGSTVHSSTTGSFNPTGNNEVSVEYNTGTYTISINGAPALTFVDSGFTPNHILIAQHIDTGILTNFNVTDLTSSESTQIVASPLSGTKTVGQPFTVEVKVEDGGEAFNAARANVAVSSNLEIVGINTPSSNACNLQYTQTPTTSNPSFAGAIFGGSSTGCTVYTMTLKPTASGTGTVTFTNASIKAYSDNSEILTGVQNASFTLGDGATPTPTPLLEFQITNPVQTYKTNFDLTGTKLATISKIFVNGSDTNSTYPTSTTWQVPVTLNLGENNFTLYGSDDNNNQTATQTVTVDRHALGDINGDGNVDLIDASLFAVDWDKTENLTYILSDMNDDGQVNLTDLSILAKLQ